VRASSRLSAHTVCMSTSAINRKRQPAGTPTGGRFAAEARAGAGVSLAATGAALLPGDYQVNDDFPYPQANDLDKVSEVAYAVRAGATTPSAIAQALDVHEREGAYYADAAGYLGLVEPVQGADVRSFSVTGLGEQFALADDQDRADLVAAMVDRTPPVAVLDEEGVDGLADFYNTEGLSPQTAHRRAATISSWADQVGDPQVMAGAVRSLHSEVVHRAPVAAERAREEARVRRLSRQRVEPEVRVCPSCFMQVAASGACGCEEG